MLLVWRAWIRNGWRISVVIEFEKRILMKRLHWLASKISLVPCDKRQTRIQMTPVIHKSNSLHSRFFRKMESSFRNFGIFFAPSLWLRCRFYSRSEKSFFSPSAVWIFKTMFGYRKNDLRTENKSRSLLLFTSIHSYLLLLLNVVCFLSCPFPNAGIALQILPPFPPISRKNGIYSLFLSS